MKVFLSYPHANAEIATALATRLRAEGHEVFWDRMSLPSGESFDNQIRDAIEDSDLFICLISEHSLKEGKYARTELKFAEQKWPNPSGKVLPVVLDDAAMETLPPYLKAVTVERPEGDPVAEVVAEVERIARHPVRRLIRVGRVVGVLALVVAVGWIIITGLGNDPITLTLGMSGHFYSDSISEDTQLLEASTDYTKLLERGLDGQVPVDGEELLRFLEQDQAGPNDAETSPLPILHFRIVNNADETIVVDRLRLIVHESRIDERPLFWGSSIELHSSAVINASFLLGNNGWGPAEDVRFTFDLVAEHDLGVAGEPGRRASRRFEKHMAVLESGTHTTWAFWEELAAFGTDISFLRDGPHPFDDTAAQTRFAADVEALKAALGANRDERFYAIGELAFSWGSGQSAQLLFQQQLQIVYPFPPLLPMLLAEVTYEIELRPEGMDYQVDRQIAHSIESGATEAIDLRVWCEKSSLHDLTAAIRVGDDWIEASDNLKLEYYRPVGSNWVGGTQ